MAYYDGRFKVAKDGKHLKLTDDGLGQFLGLAGALDDLKSSLEKSEEPWAPVVYKKIEEIEDYLAEGNETSDWEWKNNETI